jgi:DNA invertase Pin-like site-specific DNA recombinase
VKQRKAIPTVPGLWVAYIRTSTKRQSLGLDAQREAIARHVAAIGGNVAHEYSEQESGADDDRPQLTAALAKCREIGATLIVAKLDRLSRRVAFIARLMDERVPIVCCDYPSAPILQLHIVAAFAQDERRLIAERTKAALQAAKLKGATLGANGASRNYRRIGELGNEAKTRLARERAQALMPAIEAARAAGHSTMKEIAAAIGSNHNAVWRALKYTATAA